MRARRAGSRRSARISRGERRHRIGARDQARAVPDDARDVALGVADEHHRAPGRERAVQLARHDQALPLGPQGDEMDVRRGQAVRQLRAVLIGPEDDVLEAAARRSRRAAVR